MNDELIGGAIVALRFFVPLLILRYPLPGILASIGADAIDGAVLSGFTTLQLDGYQQFDKAFDTYYLAIASISMLRNWTDPAAITIGRLLWYYRLIGVALFATGGERYLLFVFPAAFEWYFIAYEVVRVRWRADRLTTASLAVVAMVAWIVKLPQEYWLHVSLRSTTEWAKEEIFGMDPSTPRPQVLAANLWAVPATVALVAGLVLLGRLVLRLLPPADHPPRLDAGRPVTNRRSDDHRGEGSGEIFTGIVLLEKISLVSLIAIVFAEFLGVHATNIQLVIGMAFLVIANALVSARLTLRSVPRRTLVAEIVTIGAITAPLALAVAVMTRWSEASVGAVGALFYLVLASLLIGLFDEYRQLRT